MADDKTTGQLAEFPKVPLNQFPKMTIYFGKDKQELLDRYRDLAAKIGAHVSAAGLVTAAMEVCIDTLEQEAPTKRKFKLNGKVVVV
jgi:hypothetical protein